MANFMKALTFTAALFSAGCSDQADKRGRRPESVVVTLVDLSATWHNSTNDAANLQLLDAVGRAVYGASMSLPKPIAVRFHAIGSRSLGRAPLCHAVFRPSAFSIGAKDENTISNREEFKSYITSQCPQFILSKTIEDETEIAASILTADRALALTSASARKVFLVLSDFKEETSSSAGFRGVNLSGYHFILLHKTLPEDQLDPSLQSSRLNGWKRRLSELGAQVDVVDESAALTSPQDLQALIGMKPDDRN